MSNKIFPNHLLGPVKSDATLTDLLAHPIWLWGLQVNESEDADDVQGGDETGMRPWLGSPNVTRAMLQPLILLKVKGTDLWAQGLFDVDRKVVDAVGVFGSDGPTSARDHIKIPGTPITYVAVPLIEGRENVEFVAKNRNRQEALMVGAFTPAEAEQRYEAEISSNRAFASSPANLIRKEPALLKMFVPFLRRVATELFNESRGLVFTDFAGWLEEEEPNLHQQLVTEATTEQVTFGGFSSAPGCQDITIDDKDGQFVLIHNKTGQRVIYLVLADWQREGDHYRVKGFWHKDLDSDEIVTHRVSMINGAWMVMD